MQIALLLDELSLLDDGDELDELLLDDKLLDELDELDDDELDELDDDELDELGDDELDGELLEDELDEDELLDDVQQHGMPAMAIRRNASISK